LKCSLEGVVKGVEMNRVPNASFNGRYRNKMSKLLDNTEKTMKEFIVKD